MGLRSDIRGRRLTVGSWLTIADESVAEIMVQAGFDWIAVDMEHSAITLADAQKLIRVIALAGKVPLVRVGDNDPELIKRVMDAGSHGVIVPMVNSADDAERAVRAVLYPPAGRRGVGLARAQGYGTTFPKYRNWLYRSAIVIAQIEHIDAIDNLESILSVEGIDGSIIGPYDLSGSLGFPGEFSRPAVKGAIRRYQDVCKAMKKPMGFHVVQPDARSARELIRKGYSFVAVGLDSLYLGIKAREVLKAVR